VAARDQEGVWPLIYEKHLFPDLTTELTAPDGKKRTRVALLREADAKAREVAQTDDVSRLSVLETDLGKLKKIIGVVTGSRADINRVAVPMVDAAVKGGRILQHMMEAIERAAKGRQTFHGGTFGTLTRQVPTLKDLGFSRHRAFRWRLAGLLPDDQRDELQQRIFDTEDEIWSLAPVLRAAKIVELKLKRSAYEDRAQKGGRIADLMALAEAGERFNVIYADPPWEFKVYSGQGKQRSAERYYDTSSLDAIKALPIAPLAADDCTLLLWGVWPELPGALEVIRAWGFEYKTAGFVWVKTVSETNSAFFTGMGFWTRANTEACLLATRGAPRRMAADVHQVVMAPVGEHSAKPDEVRRRIECLLLGPYLEVFARAPVEGWTVWGNEIVSSGDAE
jgi:N6-adenosine-specific RNA methylase IME4